MEKAKKILMLGGAYAQIPAITEAKKQGLYVVTCDYLPDNPGHKLADAYYNISTTDSEAVLALAEEIQPDFIMAYASDPAAPVAAYVAEQLGLPGNSYASVQILSEKDLFRKFLIDNGFNAPQSRGFSENELDEELLKHFRLPLILKPTDSSGSKGVIKINTLSDLEEAATYALSFSRKKRIVVEEFLDTGGRQLHGDGYVVDGQLAFCYLGDHHYNVQVNPFVPYATTWPSRVADATIEKVKQEVQQILSGLGFKNGPVNIEARIIGEKIYVMEIGPRNGGNFVPQVLRYITSFDMVEASINALLDKPIDVSITNGYGAYYVIHSGKEGILQNISFAENLKPYIREVHQYIPQGGAVKSFQGANAAIGVALLQFSGQAQMETIMDEIHQLVTVNLA